MKGSITFKPSSWSAFTNRDDNINLGIRSSPVLDLELVVCTRKCGLY